MPAAVPTSIPSELGAGRSAKWRIANPDYPASDGYNLRYVLHDGTNKITFQSDADGVDHLVTISSTDSSAWVAGEYRFQEYAEKEGESWVTDQGVISILPDFGAEITLDPRSKAEVMLSNIEETITALTTKQLSSYTTVSGTYTRQDIEKLFKLRTQLKAEVSQEKARQNPRTANSHRILSRFK